MKFSVLAVLALAGAAAAAPMPGAAHHTSTTKVATTTTKVATTTTAPCVTGKEIVVGWGPYKASVTVGPNGQFYGAGASSPFGAASAGAGLCPGPEATATASSPWGSAGAGAGVISNPSASASAGSPFASKSVSVGTKPLTTKAP